MRLQEHIQIIQGLPIRSKANIIKILWHFFKDHADFSKLNLADKKTETITLEELLKHIYPPRPEPLEDIENSVEPPPYVKDLYQQTRHRKRYAPAQTRKGKHQRPKTNPFYAVDET